MKIEIERICKFSKTDPVSLERKKKKERERERERERCCFGVRIVKLTAPPSFTACRSSQGWQMSAKFIYMQTLRMSEHPDDNSTQVKSGVVLHIVFLIKSGNLGFANLTERE
jgi:hypothetical protein